MVDSFQLAVRQLILLFPKPLIKVSSLLLTDSLMQTANYKLLTLNVGGEGFEPS